MMKTLAWVATWLALCVVVLGAYVRLSDAGLGCPDWPGCYGEITPLHASEHIERALAEQPEGPVSHAKAWKEMLHRYLAGTLGLLILALTVAAWRKPVRGGLMHRESMHGESMQSWPMRGWTTGLLLLVVFQALLGMWTVTLLLKPAVVSAHLLGGMSTLAMLLWLALRAKSSRVRPHALAPWALLGLLVLFAQIALGGWVSTNYAALACTDLPACQGAWLPHDMDFRHGFALVRELGRDAEGGLLSHGALTAIHWTHRVGAVATLGYLLWLAWRLAREDAFKRLGLGLALLVTAQFCLGLSNVAFSLPLPVAVAHNAGAALLLAMLTLINLRLRRTTP
jgi:cytochrome c oxidase assembly protein subunit 15